MLPLIALGAYASDISSVEVLTSAQQLEQKLAHDTSAWLLLLADGDPMSSDDRYVHWFKALSARWADTAELAAISFGIAPLPLWQSTSQADAANSVHLFAQYGGASARVPMRVDDEQTMLGALRWVRAAVASQGELASSGHWLKGPAGTSSSSSAACEASFGAPLASVGLIGETSVGSPISVPVEFCCSACAARPECSGFEVFGATCRLLGGKLRKIVPLPERSSYLRIDSHVHDEGHEEV